MSIVTEFFVLYGHCPSQAGVHSTRCFCGFKFSQAVLGLKMAFLPKVFQTIVPVAAKGPEVSQDFVLK